VKIISNYDAFCYPHYCCRSRLPPADTSVTWDKGKQTPEQGLATQLIALWGEYFRLAAQLARTEEAAKRALLRNDPAAKGSTAQRCLDLERELAKANTERAELGHKFVKYD
jgi:hypothetical protein